MNNVQKSEIIRNLKANGYKRIPDCSYLYLNEYGKIYSLKKGKELIATVKNLVLVENEYLSVPKLILLVFRKEPIRQKQHICYIDGDRSNLALSNIEYVRKYGSGLKTNVDVENLLIAIRCYFEVKKNYKVKDYFATRMYLHDILEQRAFYIEYYKKEGIEIFKSYMQGLTNNLASVAQEHHISISDCTYIVNGFLNQLINNVLSDLQNGKLMLKDYKPRKKTKTQELRELNEYLITNDFTPVRLRKRSDKEIIRDYEKQCNELRNKLLQ